MRSCATPSRTRPSGRRDQPKRKPSGGARRPDASCRNGAKHAVDKTIETRPSKTRKKKFQQKPLASPQTFPYSISSSRGRSSAGRALDWQSRGQGFDPPRLHHRECKGLRETEGLFHDKFTMQSKPQSRSRRCAKCCAINFAVLYIIRKHHVIPLAY